MINATGYKTTIFNTSHKRENIFKILQFEFHQNFLFATDSLHSVFFLRVTFLIHNENQKLGPFLAPLSPTSFKANWQDPFRNPTDKQGSWAMQILGSSYPAPWKFFLLEAFLTLKKFFPMSLYFWEVFDWCSSYCLKQLHVVTVRLTSSSPKSHICQDVALLNVKEILFSPSL